MSSHCHRASIVSPEIEAVTYWSLLLWIIFLLVLQDFLSLSFNISIVSGCGCSLFIPLGIGWTVGMWRWICFIIFRMLSGILSSLLHYSSFLWHSHFVYVSVFDFVPPSLCLNFFHSVFCFIWIILSFGVSSSFQVFHQLLLVYCWSPLVNFSFQIV